MKLLDTLYRSEEIASNSEDSCVSCRVKDQQWKKGRPHCILDYPKETYDIIVFTESYVSTHKGIPQPASTRSLEVLKEVLDSDSVVKYYITPAVKCIAVKEKDMTPNDMEVCRQYLSKTIEIAKPKLIFVCGNLPMKMLLKKSGINSKRGTTYYFNEVPVVPIYHPYSVIREPAYRFLFETDVKNSIDKYVFGKTKEKVFSYTPILQISDLIPFEYLFSTDIPVSFDIETTGLDFTRDHITSISFSTGEETIVMPIDHKDTPFTSLEDHATIINFCRAVLENSNNQKITWNGKFDCKFLLNYNIRPINIMDAQIMIHLWKESLPKSLKEAVKLFFPEQLKAL